LRKATVTFVMSVRPYGWNNSAGFHESLYLSIFLKFFEKIYVSLKSDKSIGHSVRTPVYIYISIALIFFRMRNVSDGSCRENQKTHFVFSDCVSNIVPFMR